MDLASAFYGSCVLFAASDLGVFKTLAERGPAGADAVAESCGLHPRGARLLLNACVALELLCKDGDRYRLTPESEAFLVPGRPGDLSRALRYNRDVYRAWGRVGEMAKTGKPVERPELHLGADMQRTRNFVLSMHGRAMAVGRAVVPMLDLPDDARVLDVGGGSGAYSALICGALPGARCAVIDLPAVVAVARDMIAEQGLSDRIECREGDYHEAQFPGGQDAVLLFGILHQETPEAIAELVRRSASALKPGGRLYVLDMMTDAGHCRPAFSALFAVNMALTTENGWVFSDGEMRAWMEAAGLTDITCRALPPPMPHWLMAARRPTPR
jgi:ubiquinone/menaquinone biosynthesis C-methylase UbiE